MTEPHQACIAILPGLMCDSRLFSAQLSAFPRSVIIDDFYANCTTIETMADYALARLPQKFALLGHSMGARIALEVWRKAPERVARLALCDTGVHASSVSEAEKRQSLIDLGHRQGLAALVRAWLPPMLAHAHRRADTGIYATLEAMCLDAGLACFERQNTALLGRPAVENLLPRIACPTFVVAGELDGWSPPAQHADIAARIAGAVLRVVPGAGHMLPAEAPDAFNRVIAEWLTWSPDLTLHQRSL